MLMATKTRAWTRADLHSLPDDGNRYEVLGGELLVTPAPSASHQAIVDWLSAKLTPFVVKHRLGWVQHPRSVMVVDGSEVEPDLMVRPGPPVRAWEDAPVPLLVIEVISRSTRRRDLGGKRAFYIEAGVAEYWAVERDTRTVLRITAAGEERVSELMHWEPPNSGARLQIEVAVMFSEVLGFN
jgi:Uma2 family endonuclease